MATYFSASAGAFYDDTVVALSAMPADRVPVTDARYTELMAAQAAGSVIVADTTGNPTVMQQTCGTCTCTIHEMTPATTEKLGHVMVDGETIHVDGAGKLSVPLPPIASSEEALAGTDNTKMMTPARVAEALAVEAKARAKKDAELDALIGDVNAILEANV
ncbi:MAG: hypothetical protein ACI4RT_09625 [Candidatus Spyradenecus sp.]